MFLFVKFQIKEWISPHLISPPSGLFPSSSAPLVIAASHLDVAKPQWQYNEVILSLVLFIILLFRPHSLGHLLLFLFNHCCGVSHSQGDDMATKLGGKYFEVNARDAEELLGKLSLTKDCC